jgi:hypothetical protein
MAGLIVVVIGALLLISLALIFFLTFRFYAYRIYPRKIKSMSVDDFYKKFSKYAGFKPGTSPKEFAIKRAERMKKSVPIVKIVFVGFIFFYIILPLPKYITEVANLEMVLIDIFFPYLSSRWCCVLIKVISCL